VVNKPIIRLTYGSFDLSVIMLDKKYSCTVIIVFLLSWWNLGEWRCRPLIIERRFFSLNGVVALTIFTKRCFGHDQLLYSFSPGGVLGMIN